ncbi:hypothetical protein AK830_g10810 [Neonectria ditissima]|uniref:Uncharacterized protein n=1 Tax=Neonectria ditissima TaxID=78410 RepID=A0A0N8H5C1_9HYPO|nr:hypothetical protein AK830_g10810 [Neonectria ditissima]
MALSTATVMRTLTSYQLIATTITAQPEVATTTVLPEPTTVVNSAGEEPVADASQVASSSSIETSILSSTSSLVVPLTSVVSTTSLPILDELNSTSSNPTPSESTSVELTTSIPASTSAQNLNSTQIPTTTQIPTSSSTPLSASSVADQNTPVFAKRPTQPVGESQIPQPPPTSPTNTPSEEFVPQTTSEATSAATSAATSVAISPTTPESLPQTTEESVGKRTKTASSSESIEKAVLQPIPGASTASTTSSSASSAPSDLSSIISSIVQTQLETTTAASVPQSTQSVGNSTPNDDGSGITNPQSTLTTATLPGGRLTTIGLDATAASDQVSSPSDTGIGIVEASNSVPPTPVLVGSIFGGFALLSAIVCLLWFLRRRMTKKRRSTLLTPLGLPPGAGRSEKKYEIDTESLGPTPRSTKLAAALSFYPKKFGEKLTHLPASSSSSGVNMNRGNSQFLDEAHTHSRSGSVEHQARGTEDSNRLQGWWSRVIQDTSSEDLSAQDMAERANYPGHGRFSSVGGGRLGRETQQQRMTRGHSVSSWTDGAPSPNPFTDASAVVAGSTKQYYPAPLQPRNPFADSHSITPPATAQMGPAGYAQEVQRSRGQSTGRGPSPRATGRLGNLSTESFYRDSGASISSFEERRNKTHSNPFDLEMERHQHSVDASMGPPPRVPVPSSIYDMPRPNSARTRGDSFTSRYTSGAGWTGEYGTMAPASSRWNSNIGYMPIGHSRSDSDNSAVGRADVGQAM